MFKNNYQINNRYQDPEVGNRRGPAQGVTSLVVLNACLTRLLARDPTKCARSSDYRLPERSIATPVSVAKHSSGVVSKTKPLKNSADEVQQIETLGMSTARHDGALGVGAARYRDIPLQPSIQNLLEDPSLSQSTQHRSGTRASQRERGAMVLIFAVILIAAASVVTAVSMRTSAVQERLTTNYSAKQNSMLRAEFNTSDLLSELESWRQSLDTQDAKLVRQRLAPGASSEEREQLADQIITWLDQNCTNTDRAGNLVERCGLRSAVDLEIRDQGVSAVVVGNTARGDSSTLASTALRVFFEIGMGGDDGDDSRRSIYEDAILGCQGINMVGGAQIDSYDSRLGGYGAAIRDESGADTGESNSLRRAAVVRTLTNDATGNFSGNAPLYGDLRFSGSQLALSGGTPVFGNVFTDGNVDMNGTIHGNLIAGGDVTFGTASNQIGGVTAGGNVTVKATGNPPANGITAGGTVTWPSWWQWNADKMALAANYQGNQSVSIAPIAVLPAAYDEECDPLALARLGPDGEMIPNPELEALEARAQAIEEVIGDDRLSVNQNRVQLKAGQDGNRPNSLHDWALGEANQDTIIRVDRSLTTAGGLHSLEIRGDVTLIVDGDLDIGNATQINVAPNSTLTLYVRGKTTFSGGSNLLQGDSFVVGEGDDARPAVRLFSLYSDVNNQGKVNTQQPGVFVGGANASRIAVYAPNTAARIVGSGAVFGAVRAGYVDIRGSGDIHFDEALGTSGMIEGDDGESSSGEEGIRILSWRELTAGL
ncbi:MAG: hypothetical protein ACK4IT_01325 [Thioalkalivibrionaceae bacterium]